MNSSSTMNLDGNSWLLSTDSENVGRNLRWYNEVTGEAKATRVPGIIQETSPTYHGVVWYWRDMKPFGLVPIKGIQNMKEVHGYDSARDYSGKGMREGRLPKARKAVRMITSLVPENILAWYTRDEPNELMYPLVKGLHDIVNEEDPYHPSLTVIFSPHLFPAYHSATDILGPEIYPGFPGGRVGRVGEAMGKAVGDMRGKPVIAVLQTFYEDNGGRMPNRSELRCMTYHSIVHGVTGILYFSYHYGGPMAERDPQT